MDKQMALDPATGELLAPDDAWNRHQRIVTLRNVAEKTFLALGEELYKFYYSEDYTKLGYETFESYLADPDVDISRGTATKLIEVYRNYNLKLNIFAAKLLPIGTEKLYLLSKHIDETNVEEWLNKAAALSRSDLKEEIARSFPPPPPPPFPEGKFRVIYADPPWKYGNTMPDYFVEQGDHYQLLELEEICAIPIKDIVEDDAVLFIWVTSPILEEAFEVIRAWGFEYKSSFVWNKERHVLAHYNSMRHEFLLVCTRGSCLPDIHTNPPNSVITERPTEHSRKPEIFRTIIDNLYIHGRRIELFARRTYPGWEVYGNEIVS
jgi:N6-adenosine-specific RNA methylase IME4